MGLDIDTLEVRENKNGGLARKSETNANTEVVQYRYDPAGSLTNRTTPAKGLTVYKYDAAGNLRKQSA